MFCSVALENLDDRTIFGNVKYVLQCVDMHGRIFPKFRTATEFIIAM
jgi:hypothetical protein